MVFLFSRGTPEVKRKSQEKERQRIWIRYIDRLPVKKAPIENGPSPKRLQTIATIS